MKNNRICCIICSDKSGENVVLSQPCKACMSYWCQSCLSEHCEFATRSITDMPPKCCIALDPRIVLQFLPETNHDRYKRLFLEYRTEAKDRVYCPNSNCTTFISPYEIRKQQISSGECLESKTAVPLNQLQSEVVHRRQDSAMANQDLPIIQCPSCKTEICIRCKKNSHEGACRLEDDPVVAQIRKFGYKRCPRCGYGTRRMWGCSHMQCVCGAHWCWNCERNYNVCDALGGCDNDDDGDDDDSNLEDPEEGTEIADGEAKTDPEETGHNLEGINNPESTTQNLDRGSHAYWERQGLNFGDEPSSMESEETWGCPHDFDQPMEKAGDDLGKQLCWDCWTTIDEQYLKCWMCNLVRCKDCQKLL
ncbi:hypothetical protein, variant 1 [Verruconis gallopava]|nr:hypothetical protein, variant 1 [Verruconis gallopava]KIW06410.1 hypothetical protein, variant 1 [Verruconis gallopava]